MKQFRVLTVIAILIFGFTACSSDDDANIQDTNTLDFSGSFSREFEVQGNTQRATYTISQNKINYDLNGEVQANYDIKKESYSAESKRWVGFRESNSTYYVIFFKTISDNEITLYKKEVSSLEQGKSAPIPADNDTENHGWNVYKKDLPISGKTKNLHAPQTGGQGQPVGGEFTKFDFSTGAVTTSSTDWDIAFRGTTIIVNGGQSQETADEPERTGNAAAYIANNTFEGVVSVDENLFVQDSKTALAIPTGSGNGWYTYTGPPKHLINPTAGKILVFKTRNGNYAKVEILSYYKNAPIKPDTAVDESRYFTFNYVYQPNKNATTF